VKDILAEFPVDRAAEPPAASEKVGTE